jgi:hypothetical protein
MRGTRKVAIVPTWATVNARRNLPEDALPALGDALLESPWNTPPRFVAILPADQVDRDLRRMGLARRTLTFAEAGRLARTTGLILQEESSLGRVLDPAEGSWFLESLTSQLAEVAWDELRRLDAAGGIIAAIESGDLSRRIAEAAAARHERVEADAIFL